MAKNDSLYKRFLWADLIRSLAITLVVFAHVSAPVVPHPPNSFDWWTSIFYSSFSRLGVPLFVMLSGALILPKPKPVRTFFRGRFYKIVIPWVCWALLYTLWFMIQKNTQLHLYDFIQLYYQTFLGHFWFLPMLFGLYFLTPLIWRFLEVAKEKDILYAIGIWFILLSVVPFFQHIAAPGLVLSTSYVLIHSGYYLLGYFITTFNKKFVGALLMLGYIAAIGINTLGQGLLALFGRSINFFMQNISPFIVLATVMLFTFMYHSSQKLEKGVSKKLQTSASFISGISMGVFFAHGLVIHLFDTTTVGKAVNMFALPYFVAVPLRTVIIFTLTGAVVVLLQKLPVMKLLVPK